MWEKNQRVDICVHVWLIHFAIEQKHNIVNQLYANKNFKKENRKL